MRLFSQASILSSNSICFNYFTFDVRFVCMSHRNTQEAEMNGVYWKVRPIRLEGKGFFSDIHSNALLFSVHIKLIFHTIFGKTQKQLSTISWCQQNLYKVICNTSAYTKHKSHKLGVQTWEQLLHWAGACSWLSRCWSKKKKKVQSNSIAQHVVNSRRAGR